MSSRQQNIGLVALAVLIYSQVVCFFLNAGDNFSATFRLSFMGHKGAALVRPIVQIPITQIQSIILIGHTLMWFYLVCCLIFFLLPIGLFRRKPIFFRVLLFLDAVSLFLGLYGYYFWATSGLDLTSTERLITLIEPFLSSGGLVLLIGVPALRNLWLHRSSSQK